jgi:hypothetical protein
LGGAKLIVATAPHAKAIEPLIKALAVLFLKIFFKLNYLFLIIGILLGRRKALD